MDKLENTKEFSNFMFDYDYDRVKFEMKNFNVKLNEEASDHSPNMIPNTGKSKLPPISQSKLRNIKLSINLEMTTTERKKPPTPTHDHPEVSLPPECKNK